MISYRLLWVAGAVAIASCQGPQSAVAPPASSNFPQSPPRPITPIPEPPDQTTSALPDDAQIYQDENGMFALALPAGYAYTSEPQGMTFQSPDGGFRGEIVYLETKNSETEAVAEAEASSLPLTELEARLKQAIQADLAEVTWQGAAEEQADGSLRLAWTGVNQEGEELDALSFIEEHHNTLFILKLHGVGQTYSSYNSDARIIVGSYTVRRDFSEAEPG
ncbi:MAG: hypothetical protein ACFB8W_04920 [Elainellaceae cyanobacterium]